MTQAMLILHLEHQNTGKLLGLIERELLALQAGKTPDYDLLNSIGDYLMDYPDQCHHPKEDLVFAKLQQRDSGAARRLGNLLDEHRETGSPDPAIHPAGAATAGNR